MYRARVGNPDPSSDPDPDKALASWRRRVAGRERAKGLILFGGFAVLMAVITVIRQPSSAKSYANDAPGYWIALATLLALIGASLIVAGIRGLRRSSAPD